jgi:hypothetical protein
MKAAKVPDLFKLRAFMTPAGAQGPESAQGRPALAYCFAIYQFFVMF